MLPSELKNTIEQFIVYAYRNEAHFNYIYVYHTNVFEAHSIYKNPAPNVISHIFFCYFFRSGAPPMTLLTGVGRVPPPPNKNPGYAGLGPCVSNLYKHSRAQLIPMFVDRACVQSRAKCHYSTPIVLRPK